VGKQGDFGSDGWTAVDPHAGVDSLGINVEDPSNFHNTTPMKLDPKAL
jgi:hypothetical protein